MYVPGMTVRYFKLFLQDDQRMVALFSGDNESEDWFENKCFDQVFSSGWHLFAKEQLVSVDEAKAQGVWRLDLAPPMIQKTGISRVDLINLYLRCANRAWEGAVGDSESVARRVCDSLELAQIGGAAFVSDSVRIGWYLKRVDELLKQWANVQDPSVGFEIAAVFQLLAQMTWPDDQADQCEKSAFNAVYWWNQTLALVEQRLQQAFERSDWPEAMHLLELLMKMNADRGSAQ